MARKKLQKLFALLLTFSLSMSLLSVGAFAAEGDDDGKIQLSSVYLPDTEKTRSVPFGTSEESLQLPGYLLGIVEPEDVPPAEVQAVQELPTGNSAGDIAQTPEDQGNTTENPENQGSTTEDPENQGSTTENPENQGSTTENPENQENTAENPENQGSTTENPENQDNTAENPENQGSTTENPENQDNTMETLDEITDVKKDPNPEDTEKVPVTWTCDDGYTGWIAGEYKFTAKLDGSYAYNGDLPTVTVTVEEQAEYVAQIGETRYETLQDAMNAVSENGYGTVTITLLGNVLLDDEVQLLIQPDTTLDLTLDLANHEIAGAPDAIASNLLMRNAADNASKTAEIQATVKNGTFSGLHAKGTAGGGAIAFFNNLVVENCVFRENSSGSGGAIQVIALGSGPLSTVEIKDCTFIGNSAPNGGGAVSATCNKEATFEDVTFIDNSSDNLGGAIYTAYGTVEISDCTFRDNSAVSGGAVGCDASAVTVEDSTFTDNNASITGGAAHIQGVLGAASMDITGGSFCDNHAGYGGAIYAATNCSVVLSGSTVSSNTADTHGGAFYTQGSCTLDITTDLTDNEARDDGGAIYINTGTVTVNGDLTDNSAGRNGGAICTFFSTVDVNGTVSGNSAAVGGGIYTGENAYGEAYDGKINLLDASVYNNTADEEGADIWQGSHNQMDLKEVGSDWVLEECDHVIDGWYYDQSSSRWSENSAWFFALDQLSGTACVADAVALKAAHSPTPLDPGDPGLPDWEVSKSKTATNLDANYESQVTLSLPAASYKGDLDVVFVLDGSTSSDQNDLAVAAADLLSTLAGYENLNVKAGVVIFGGSTPVLDQTQLLALSDENLNALMGMIQNKSYDGDPGRSGSNLQAGVDAARALLNGDGTVSAEDKYMVILTDGAARMWHDGEGNALSQTYLPDGKVFWNSNEDFAARYPTGEEAPEFSEVWDAGQSGINIGKYAMTQEEATTADKTDSRIASWDTVKNGEDYFTTLEAATYYAATSIVAAQRTMHVLWVDYPYYNNETIHAPYINSFKDWLDDNGYITRYDTTTAEPDEVFSAVEDNLIQLVDAGSKVVDVIGYGTDNQGNGYDFDFVNDIDALTLTVGGVELDKTELIDPQFDDHYVTSAYGFGSDDHYDFILRYYANGQDGKSDECFVWEINVPVTKDTPVELTYSVKLTNPQTDDGSYGQFDADGSEHYASLLTNLSATLYPMDSNGKQGTLENFAKPTVSYTVNDEGTNPGPGPGGDDDDDDDDDHVTIPDDDTPTTDIPGDIPSTDIPDGDTPTTDVPGTDLDDPDVPLADVPKTGDASALWLALSALSGTGLAGVTFLGRKKHDEE